MHKNMFYLKKNWKITAALGLRPQTSELLLPSLVTVIFLKTFVALT